MSDRIRIPTRREVALDLGDRAPARGCNCRGLKILLRRQHTWETIMFEAGTAVGPIQPYFLSQIEAAFDRSKPLSDPANQAIIEAQAVKTAGLLADFIAGAQHRLDIAIYDFRLATGKAHDLVVDAINTAARRGVAVRIGYDKDQEDHSPGTIDDFLGAGADPAPNGTNEFVESGRFDAMVARKGITTEGIDPQHHIMHQKYILRDALTAKASVLMGSANFTLDAWAAQENNILAITDVPDLVRMYSNDFGELWTSGKIGSTGVDDSGHFTLGGSDVQVSFAPGKGTEVEGRIADTIAAATDRLYVASMVISSGKILRAISNAMADVQDFGGIYDGGSMAGVEHSWSKSTAKTGGAAAAAAKSKLDAFSSAEKLAIWDKLKPHFIAKHSIKFQDALPHNFMHDKVAVADDTVITGSFNFSNNAMKNAENILVIRNRALADQYVTYIKGLLQRYGQGGAH
jgi:phosphatidylserine/phosphatidylglycerophosphate/cardiolipin synthase-like enzyme